MYQKVGKVLDKLGQSSAAFRVMFAALKLFKENDADISKTEQDARRCVILAIKAVDIINFAELEDLAPIKSLTKKQAKVLSLLNLFTQASTKDFKNKLSEFSELMTSEGLTESELVLKKSYVQICTLNTQKTNFSF